MTMKVYIDSDVILDVLIARDPHALNSAKVISLCEERKIQGFTSSIAILNVAYVLGKSKLPLIKSHIQLIKSILKIQPTTAKDIDYALDSEFNDFEDAVQSSVALSKKLEYIVTRNFKDYKSSEVPAITPEQFLKVLSKK